MNKNQGEDLELTQIIIKLIQNEKPQDVQQLVKMVKEKTSIPEPKIIEHIIQLQNQGKISLKDIPKPAPQKLSIMLRTKEAYWYWTTLILTTTTTVIMLTIPENAYPIVYIRYVLGTIFILWLPGYSLTKALFPKEKASKSLNSTERITLSITMSLALASILGFLLNYSPWGIRLTPIVLSSLVLTIVFATAGIVREYQSQIRKT